MSVADDLLAANAVFARSFDLGDLKVQPRRHVAVLSCMDSRILFEHCLGLRPGDAHMIRNAGGIATEDAIRSLLVSHHLLDTQEFIIINHTDCGLLKVKEYELRAKLAEKMGTVASEPGQSNLAVPTLQAKLEAQCEGLAVGTLPACVAAGPIAEGRLVSKRVTGMREETQCYLAWRDDEMGRALQWWLDQLRQPRLAKRLVQGIDTFVR